jgi:hypothetical protein
MDGKFRRFASAIFGRNPSEDPDTPASRLDRVTHPDRQPEAPDRDRRSNLSPETSARPLYDSSVYHSKLEELPTFAANYLNEAAAERIAQALEPGSKG